MTCLQLRVTKKITSTFSSNSEASTSELQEHFEEEEFREILKWMPQYFRMPQYILMKWLYCSHICDTCPSPKGWYLVFHDATLRIWFTLLLICAWYIYFLVQHRLNYPSLYIVNSEAFQTNKKKHECFLVISKCSLIYSLHPSQMS